MRVALLADIHANLEALRAVLADLDAGGGVDHLVCLGDVVGYNADPAACLDLVRRRGMTCVAGNHDRAVAGLIPTPGSDTARRAVEWTRHRLDTDALAHLAGLPLQAEVEGALVAVHGTLTPAGGCERTYIDGEVRRVECLEALAAHPSGARLCAFGHTHHLAAFEGRDGQVTALVGDAPHLAGGALHLLNPGTVGEPRTAETRATAMILDLERREVSVRRVAYDREAALAKTRAAGLAPRLTAGRVANALRWRARRLGAWMAAGAGR